MAKVQEYTNSSLGDLGITRGDLVAFDNTDREHPYPFVITRAENIVDYHRDGGLRLAFMTQKGLEKWTLIPLGGMNSVVNLLTQECLERDGYRVAVPNFRRGQFHLSSPYPVEFAYSGKREISDALFRPENFHRLGVYSHWIDTGDFVVQRGRFGKILEDLDLEAILPTLPRFRRETQFML